MPVPAVLHANFEIDFGKHAPSNLHNCNPSIAHDTYEVQEARVAIASQKRAERRARQRSNNCGLSIYKVSLAIAVYVLSDNSVAVATEFLRQELKLTEGHDLEAETTWLRDKYLSWPLDDLHAMVDPTSEKHRKLHNAAVKFVASFKANEYVETANITHGATPDNRQVAEEYIRQCNRLGDASLNPGLRGALDGSRKPATAMRCVRKWGRRFRARWGLGFGDIPVREPLEDAEIQEKACSCQYCEFCTLL